ncbi:MAG: GNAT family N-acetyltransferase [Clostridiales bacterium]|nr:GNAT family N-acetyltransferase [Clostridiales bacterium]
MDYKIITDEDALIAEKDTWTEICAKMPNASPFQTWEWNYIWWKNNEPVDSLYVIKAFEGKKVFGYAPFVLKDGWIEFIGGRDMDYGRFVVYQKEVPVIEGVLQLLLEKKYALRLQEMAAGDTQLHIVQKVLCEKKKYLCYQTTRTMWVQREKYGSFEEYFALLSQSMRNKTIKVGLKKGLTMQAEEVNEKVCEEIQEIFDNRQEVRGGSHDISWAITVIREMNAQNLLDVYIARDNGKPVGFLVAMKYRNSVYIWLVAFKMEYKDAFPGQMLFYQVIKDAFANGYDKVDFMRGDYDFKARWECSLDSNYTVCVYRRRFARWKKKVALKWRPRLKKIVYGSKFLKRFYKKHAK